MREGLSIAEQVVVWKKTHEVVNHGRQLICCVPYRCEQSLMTCRKRLDAKLYYVAQKRGYDKAVRPQFLSCIDCNVREYITKTCSVLETV